MRREAEAKSDVYTRRGGRGGWPRQRSFCLTALDKETPYFRLKFCEDAIESLPARIEYDRPLGIQRRQLEAHGFAHSSFESVTHHGFAEGSGRGKADTRSRCSSFHEAEGGKEGTTVARPLIVNFSEIARSKQPDTFGKAWDPGYLSELTVSFLRPCARRREMTACPSAVFMRVRKPCVLARRRLFGWKVRFGIVFFSERYSGNPHCTTACSRSFRIPPRSRPRAPAPDRLPKGPCSQITPAAPRYTGRWPSTRSESVP
jgi:hypothetical protein